MEDIEENGQGPLTGKEPIELGEGKELKTEPVLPEDVDKIGKLNKDALRVYALKKFGKTIDLSTHIAMLRGDLVKRSLIALGEILEDPETDEATRASIEKVVPMYVKNSKTGRVFPSSPALLKRNDLIPCLQNGTPLKSHEYYIPEPRRNYNPRSGSEMERMAAGMENQIQR